EAVEEELAAVQVLREMSEPQHGLFASVRLRALGALGIEQRTEHRLVQFRGREVQPLLQAIPLHGAGLRREARGRVAVSDVLQHRRVLRQQLALVGAQHRHWPISLITWKSKPSSTRLALVSTWMKPAFAPIS